MMLGGSPGRLTMHLAVVPPEADPATISCATCLLTEKVAHRALGLFPPVAVAVSMKHVSEVAVRTED